MRRQNDSTWSRYVIDPLNALLKRVSNFSLLFLAFPYHAALKLNTLDPIEEIINENDIGRQDALVKRFVRSKSNESRYVQVAVSKAPSFHIAFLDWPGEQRRQLTCSIRALGRRSFRISNFLPLMGQHHRCTLVSSCAFLFKHHFCARISRQRGSTAMGIASRGFIES